MLYASTAVEGPGAKMAAEERAWLGFRFSFCFCRLYGVRGAKSGFYSFVK